MRGRRWRKDGRRKKSVTSVRKNRRGIQKSQKEIEKFLERPDNTLKSGFPFRSVSRLRVAALRGDAPGCRSAYSPRSCEKTRMPPSDQHRVRLLFYDWFSSK